ncbi:MAG: hypothetical protein KBD01_05685 [Acidobacteria bacterium]|nr:hypothetical protein [Acidobacteriota bacterium]
MSDAAHGRERGVALVIVLLVALLVCAAGAGAWSAAAFGLAGARRRLAVAQAGRTARSAACAVAGWFEAAERGSLVPPPGTSAASTELRRVDPDGDGEGEAWSDADPPWDVRYKEGEGAAAWFRPPDGPGPRDRLLGTADGPDLVVADAGDGTRVLDALTRALAPVDGERIVRVALFAPPADAGALALATVEVEVEHRAGRAFPVRARARAEIVRVDWGRLDRPLVVAGDASFLGEAGWRRGEAVVAGDLAADTATLAGWPGGVPWLAPDRPLRDDNDGDGLPDDADGDGLPDLESWRDLPDAVPDPWWRGRIAGAWPGIAAAPRPCEAPFPFGPRASPASAPDKTADRSGVFVACPAAEPPVALPADWAALARAGARGLRWAVEREDRPGEFELDGLGAPRRLDALWNERGGACLLTLASSRSVPLDIPLRGQRGALLVEGGDVRLAGDATRNEPDLAPEDLRDTRGADRPAGAGDDALPVEPDGRGWSVGPWGETDPDPRHGLPDAPRHARAVVACAGRLEAGAPLDLAGQLRAGELRLDGTTGPVTVWADAAFRDDPGRRPGPFGAPRVAARNVRDVP